MAANSRVISGKAAVKSAPTPTHVPKQECHVRTELTRTGVQQLREQASRPGMAVGDDPSTLNQKASDLVRQRRARANRPIQYPRFGFRMPPDRPGAPPLPA
ncbi:hypothetical protein [Paracoccus sp. ME4]|uniref:hypothetical protein n=1 Tax=Paracoccus sp. ME4 TaxID=3138066 RepID=UPI00398AF153